MLLANRRAALVLSLFAAACGDVVTNGDGDGDVDASTGDIDAAVGDPCEGSTIAIEDFSECYRRALCVGFTDCASFFGAFTDQQECLDNFDFVFATFQSQIDRFIAAINVGAVSYDATSLAECLQGVNDCNLSNDACDLVFIGNTLPGASCFDSFECGNGGFCDIQGGAGQCPMGSCIAPVGLGQTCGGNIRCENGLECVTDGGGVSFCQDGVVGDSCNSSFDCNDANTCGPNLTCVARVGEGVACSQQDQCTIPLDCVNTTCQRPDAAGDPCDGTCLGPLFCNANSQCEALPTLGQGCAASNRCLGINNECAPNNVCQSLAGLGDPCDGDAIDCLPSLYCNADAQRICAAKQANGNACINDGDCMSGFCDVSGGQTCATIDICYE